MTELRVQNRDWRIVVAVLCVALAVGVQVVRCQADDNAGAAYVDAVRQGLAYRASAVCTLTGMADIEYTFSPANCERGRKEAEEYARQIKWIGEVLPLDQTHRSRMEFSADFDKGQWRCDVTDLTVSGHNLWASTNDPALNRQLPPEAFRRVSVCDGTKVYDHHYSLNQGWIESYMAKPWQLAQPLADVRALITASSGVANRLGDTSYSVEFLGEEDVGGYECLKLRASRSDPSLGSKFVTFWAAPALDFAVVREEYETYLPSPSPGGKPARDITWVREESDFVKASDALWCPRTARATFGRRRADEPEGADPWEWTRTIRITSLEIGTPVTGLTTPYQFPAGTKVTDHTSGTVSVIGEEGK